MRTSKLLTLTALAVWAVLVPAYGQAINYVVTDLGTLRTTGSPTDSGARAINDSGIVVGVSMCNSGVYNAFRVKPGGVMENIQLLGGGSDFGSCNAINQSGTMTGGTVFRPSYSKARAFRCTDGGAWVNLPTLPTGVDHTDLWGWAINTSEVIAGWGQLVDTSACQPYATFAWDPCNPGRAAWWSGSTALQLPDLGGYYSLASGINDAGVICGFGALATGATHAFRIPPAGNALDLGTLGGTNSEAWAINNSGHIVGCSLTSANDNPHATLWASMTPEDLGTLPGKPYSAALGITDNGLIVGWVADSASPTYAHLGMGQSGSNARAALFRRGASPIDLNTCIATNSGWILSGACGGNAHGKIVGGGLHNGQVRAFLLTPCPMLCARKSGQQVELYWNSLTNEQYQLEQCTNVTSGAWTSLGVPITGNGTTNCVPADCAEPARYYRLIWLAN